MNFESHDTGTNTSSFEYSKEEQVAPFVMQLSLVLLCAEVMCR